MIKTKVKKLKVERKVKNKGRIKVLVRMFNPLMRRNTWQFLYVNGEGLNMGLNLGNYKLKAEDK